VIRPAVLRVNLYTECFFLLRKKPSPRDGCTPAKTERHSAYKMSATRRPRVVEAAPRRAPAKLQSVRVVVEHDPDPDVSYLEQEDFEERLAAFQAGEFSFVGVHAEADVVIEGVVQTLTSGGLWGIESDSEKEYLEEVAVQEYEELRKILKTIGVPTSELPQAFQGEIEWRA